jgi:hypothetical protein
LKSCKDCNSKKELRTDYFLIQLCQTCFNKRLDKQAEKRKLEEAKEVDEYDMLHHQLSQNGLIVESDRSEFNRIGRNEDDNRYYNFT